jgi:hypothetical protein
MLRISCRFRLFQIVVDASKLTRIKSISNVLPRGMKKQEEIINPLDIVVKEVHLYYKKQ